MRPARLALVLLGLAPIAAQTGCGDDAEESMTVWVYEEASSPGDADRPLGGAKVAVDAPGSARVVLETGVDGRVTFSARFGDGGAHVSAVTPDHALYTFMDVTPGRVAARPNTFGKPGGDLVIVLPRLDRALTASSIEVRGAIVGKGNPDDGVNVSASGLRRLGAVDTTDASYALRGPKARPFFLLGRESAPFTDDGSTAVEPLIKAFRLDVPGRADDVNLDLDLRTVSTVPTHPLHLRAVLPSASTLGSGIRGSAAVLSMESRLLVGAFRKTAPSADKAALELEVDIAETDLGGEHPFTRAILLGPDGAQSVRAELGVVPDRTTWADFAAPPLAAAPRTIADPIDLVGVPDDADLEIQVGGGGKTFWIVEQAAGSPRGGAIRLPPLFDRSFGVVIPEPVLLFSVKLVIKQDRVAVPPHGELYRRVASSREFVVARR